MGVGHLELGGDMSLLFCFPGWSWEIVSRYHGLESRMFQKMYLKGQPGSWRSTGWGRSLRLHETGVLTPAHQC